MDTRYSYCLNSLNWTEKITYVLIPHTNHEVFAFEVYFGYPRPEEERKEQTVIAGVKTEDSLSGSSTSTDKKKNNSSLRLRIIVSCIK